MKVLFGVLCAVYLIHGASAQTNLITHPSDLVGVDFSGGLAARLPYMDCTTPENAFLGYFRAGINGSMRDHLFYMTNDLKESLLEGRMEEDISDDENLVMTTMLQESEYVRVYVASLDCQPDVAPTQFLASVCSVFEGTRIVESWTVGLIYTNGVWKVNRDETEIAGRYPIGN